MTVTGIALGTAGYMSPEQIRGEKLDARTDLFSFGLVLYEMATGSRAFAGETAAIVHDAILHETLCPARELNSSLPRRLDAIISRALEKDRAQRYPSAAEMRQDLMRVRKEMRPGHQWALRWSAVVALLMALVAGLWIYVHNGVRLSPNDTIVRAEFDNQTGDIALGDGLNIALQIALEQTPYLNMLREDKVIGALSSLNLPADTKLTAQIASRVCRRTDSRAVIASSIADRGNRFHIELRAVDCATGRTLARVASDAESRDEIVRALGASAAVIRAKLGEPKSSLAEFNKPLEAATSSSPDALHFLALGYKNHLAGDLLGALGYYRKAIEKDPALASAYAGAASANFSMNKPDAASPDSQKAFELRDRLTVPTHFQVETQYYGDATGQYDEECRVTEQWVQIFPRDVIARINFQNCLRALGRPEERLVQAREAARLLPSSPTYLHLLAAAIYAERLNEAEAIYAKTMERKFDNPSTHFFHAILAFLKGDQPAMQQEWSWATQYPNSGAGILHLEEKFAAYGGRIRESRRLRKQIVDAALEKRNLYDAAYFQVSGGLLEAELGNSVQSRQSVSEALQTSEDPATMLFAALASARTGDLAQAQKLADALGQRFPLQFQIQHFALPTIRAAMKLYQHDSADAVEILQSVRPYDLSGVEHGFDSVYPSYIRGLAYLQMDDGRLAAVEFHESSGSPRHRRGSHYWSARPFATRPCPGDDGRQARR